LLSGSVVLVGSVSVFSPERSFSRLVLQVFETVGLQMHKKLCAILDVESGT
jgi:hypothetical protein